LFSQFRQNDQELSRVDALIRQGSLPEAAGALNGLRNRTPDDPRIYTLGAQLGLAANNAEAALISSERALTLEPGWAFALLNRAMALERLHRLSEALEGYRQAALAEPRMLEAIDYAANLGRRIGNFEVPESLLQNAHRTQPDDPRIWFALGRFYSRHKRTEATTWLEKALTAFPDNSELYGRLAAHAYDAGDIERAAGYIERAIELSPDDESLQFQKDRITGKNTTQIPGTIVRDLFDEYAERFDSHLVRNLKYRLPEIVAQRIRGKFPDLNINVLDLGCGTGLFGHVLGPIGGYFVGVDLSQKMLEKAAATGVYSRLHIVDMGEALAHTDAEEYEAIVANDALVYVAELTDFIANAHRCLRKGGVLIVSCELAQPQEAPIVLRPTLRYAHRVDYVRDLCESVGFASIDIENIHVRENEGKPVESFLVTATKAT
jgi:predicted TPR repeat methyltransferase